MRRWLSIDWKGFGRTQPPDLWIRLVDGSGGSYAIDPDKPIWMQHGVSLTPPAAEAPRTWPPSGPEAEAAWARGFAHAAAWLASNDGRGVFSFYDGGRYFVVREEPVIESFRQRYLAERTTDLCATCRAMGPGPCSCVCHTPPAPPDPPEST